MAKVYEAFDKKFSKVSAYAVMSDGEYAGKIVINYPKDGAGRLHVFVHEFGYEMITGFAGGCGYDKVGAALQDAFKKCKGNDSALYTALSDVTYDGQWKQVIESKGFQVYNVI